MTVVGSAEIVVRAITSQVRDDIKKAFEGARADIGKAGDQAGKDFANSFGNSVKGNLRSALSDALNDPNIGKSASSAGSNVGRNFVSGVSGELSSANFASEGDKLGGELADGMKQGIDDAAKEVGDEAEKAMSDAGNRGGRGFSKGFLSSGFAKESMAASHALTDLIVTGNVMTGAIGSLVSSLSSAVSGLFAMGAAASQAAGALGVLPGVMAVGAQAVGTMALAFQGVGKAIQAGFKEANAIPQSGQAAASAAYAVADAQEALAKARLDAARAQHDAAEQVANAENAVKVAQQGVLSAQQELNVAREQAVKDLRDLAFQAEDASLQEKQAGLNLIEARKQLVAAQALPPDDTARKQAELSYKEADLAYREAKARNQDMADAEKKAAKTGVDGTAEVISAKKKVNDAQKSLASAEQNLNDARIRQQRQLQDSMQSIADAQTRLARAQAAATASMKGSSATAQAYKQALANLSPPARQFVKYILSMKPAFDSLRKAAGQGLFPGLEQGVKNFSRALPLLQGQLHTTGTLLGDAFAHATSMFDSGKNNRLGHVLQGNNDILATFLQTGRNGENVMDMLARLALRLVTAVQPLTKRFAEWTRSMIIWADKATNSRKEMGKLTDFFNHAGDVAAQLGRIFKNLGDTIFNLGKDATPAGQGLLNSFEKATAQLDKFVKKPKNAKELTQFFKDAAKNLKSIGSLAAEIGKVFLGLGDNKGVGKLAKELIPAVDSLGKVADNGTKAAPALGRLAQNAAKLVQDLSGSKGIKLYIDHLATMAGWADKIVGSKFGQHILNWAVTFTSWAHTISFVLGPLKFLFKALVGGPLSAIAAFKKFTGFMGRMPKAFKALRENGIRAAFAELSKSSDGAKAAFERQMKTDKLKTKVLEKLEIQSDKTAGALNRLKQAGEPAVQAAAAAATGNTGTAESAASNAATGEQLIAERSAGSGGLATVGAEAAAAEKTTTKATGKIGAAFSKLKTPFSSLGKSVKGLGGLFAGLGGGMMDLLGGPVGLILAAIPLVVLAFKKLYEHSPQFRKFVDGIVTKLKELGAWVGKIFNKYVWPALNSFFGWINKNMPKIQGFFSATFKVIGSVISGVFDFILKHWKTIATALAAVFMGPIGAVVVFVITHWNTIKNVTKKVWDSITGFISNAVSSVINFVKKHWKLILGIITGPIGAAVIFITSHWDTIKKATSAVWSFIKDAISREVDGIKNIWHDFVSAFDWVKDQISDKVDLIKDIFGKITGFVKDVFGGLKDIAKTGIDNFISNINRFLIQPLNSVTSHFGLHIPDIPGLAEGGPVKGAGGPTEDNQIRRLSVGEYVIKASSVKAIGEKNVEHINKHGTFPAQGTGGLGSWLLKGAGYALGKLIGGFEGTLDGIMPRSGSFINKFVYGILDKLENAVSHWGDSQQKAMAANFKPVSGPIGTGPFVKPAGSYRISQMYVGPYPKHSGLDMAMPIGTPLYAVTSGRIGSMQSLTSSYGRNIDLLTKTVNILYAHMSRFAPGLYPGSMVKAGQKLGWSGQSGNTTGPHLHLEVRPGTLGAGSAIDPLEWLRLHGVRLAQGGVVQATPGGVLSVIGEAGRNERVEPLDRSGLSDRDRAMIDLIRQTLQSNGSGDVYQIYPSRGMDEMELAEFVTRKVRFHRRRGA